MFDHVLLVVADFDRSRAFYVQSLAPLGAGVVMEIDDAQHGPETLLAFGANGVPSFWIAKGATPTCHAHIAFAAATRADVNAFHAAAMSGGGTDNGQPGLRPQYHPNYYGAFIIDPDGNNIEAVCQKAV